MAQTPQVVIDGLPPRFHHDQPPRYARLLLGRRTMGAHGVVCAHCGAQPDRPRRHVCMQAIEDYQLSEGKAYHPASLRYRQSVRTPVPVGGWGGQS